MKRLVMIVVLFFFMSLHYCMAAQPECYVDPNLNVTSKTMRIQEATFRLLQGTAYRLWQNATWCYDHQTPDGRPYNFTEAKAMILSLLDLEMLLQFDQACVTNLMKLRQLLIDVTEKPRKNDDWWRTAWYNTSLEAFSCGFIPPKNYSFVPHDLKGHIEGNIMLQKTWRLVQDWIWSSYKMKEFARRRDDYDVSLYIPFIDNLVNTKYMEKANMRVGFPYYIGTTNWFLFHSLAQRIADLEQEISLCTENGIPLLLDRFKNMFLGFIKSGQPCPDCREHFLSKVSNNDRFRQKVNESEGYLFYPIEWLILGGDDGTFESKFASISSPKELVFFLWKLHNAVSSSVNGSVECHMEEYYDGDSTMYQCFDENIPRTHRLWPVSMRYEFAMMNYNMWDWSRDAINITSCSINVRDTSDLRSNLWEVWSANEVPNNDTRKTLSLIQAGIASLEETLWNGGLFTSEYSISTAWSCVNFNSTLQYVTKVEPPVMSTNWDTMPSVCVKSAAPSTMSKAALTILAVVLTVVVISQGLGPC